MLEPHIKILATIYTALLMTAIAVLMVYGGFEMQQPTFKGQRMKAIMVDISQLKATQKSTKKPKKVSQQTKPKKTPKKQPKEKPIQKVTPPKKKPAEIVKPKIDKEKLKREKQKQEQEREKEQQELKRIKKLQEEIRKKKLKAKKEREQAEKDLQELVDNIQKEEQTIAEPIGNPDAVNEADEKAKLLNLYQQAIVTAVERQWNKPVSSTKNLVCYVRVKQLIGGTVVDASIASPCNANNIVKKSILDAIKKADPLPYKGFEEVFDRNAIFIFKPEN